MDYNQYVGQSQHSRSQTRLDTRLNFLDIENTTSGLPQEVPNWNYGFSELKTRIGEEDFNSTAHKTGNKKAMASIKY